MNKVLSMPIHLSWHNDAQREIIVQFRETWTWAQFYAADINCRKMMYDVQHPVTVVLDARGAMLPPPELPAHLLAMTRYAHPHLDKLIIVRDTVCAREIVALLKRCRPADAHHFSHAPTLQDALAIARGET